ncbi:MAG: hypothetical protein ACK41D_02805 [Rubricoccaceae bacterium]
MSMPCFFGLRPSGPHALGLAALVALAACASDDANPNGSAPPSGSAPPPEAAAVRDEPLQNPDEALVLGLETGDRACYLSLEDANGVPFQELADFALCERDDLVGQRVRLAYEEATVPAEICQGDPECTETTRMPIVRTATPLEQAVPGAADTTGAGRMP